MHAPSTFVCMTRNRTHDNSFSLLSMLLDDFLQFALLDRNICLTLQEVQPSSRLQTSQTIDDKSISPLSHLLSSWCRTRTVNLVFWFLLTQSSLSLHAIDQREHLKLSNQPTGIDRERFACRRMITLGILQVFIVVHAAMLFSGFKD